MTNIYHMPEAFLNRLAGIRDKRALVEKLHSAAKAMGVETFKKKVAEELVKRTQPASIIPDTYHEYRSIVQDGILFFLSGLSIRRLADIVADQLTMDRESCPGERLLELAKKCPTLHKLGQIIARNKNIDTRVRKWLIHLENGNYGTTSDKILPLVEGYLQQEKSAFAIQLDDKILSEASVGAVCSFRWRDPGKGSHQDGVFKVLKPGICSRLKEELRVLEDLAANFANNRHRYHLKDFKFIETFQDISQSLSEEVNLLGEQSHLWDAYQFYKDMEGVRVPRIVPFSDQNLTAMEFVEGVKVTDILMTPAERKACARQLFKAIILKPLFSTAKDAIFHGDPHAGNILATREKNEGPVILSLIDWSLAGHLSKTQRIGLVQLIQSVVKENVDLICRSIMALSAQSRMTEHDMDARLKKAVTRLIHTDKWTTLKLIEKAFWLVDQTTRQGVVFPSDLLLFRKTLFTLVGILDELDPSFDIDTVMMKYLTVLIIGEFPTRLGCLIFPLTDTPENYQSLISNRDLQLLFLHHVIEGLHINIGLMSGLMKKQFEILGIFFQIPMSALSITSRALAAMQLHLGEHSVSQEASACTIPG